MKQIFTIIAVSALTLGCHRNTIERTETQAADTAFQNPKELQSYCEKRTGILWPASVTNVDIYDNGQFYVVGYFEIPTNQTSEFTTKYAFSSVPHAPFLLGMDSLKPQNRTLPAADKLLELEGANETNHIWNLYLEKETGRVWIQVTYPDWAGD